LKPLVVDLFTGLHGWWHGFEAAGYRGRGYDLEDMCAKFGEPQPEGDFELVLKDIRAMHGSEIADADFIVGSSPCTDYSYMAMPWTRAKAKAAAIRADGTGEALRQLNELFDAQFRIQREASEAAGRHIPMVVENVRGAIPWVGRSRANFGSYHLWGDVPALMPATLSRKNDDLGGGSRFNIGSPGQTVTGANPDGRKIPGFRFDGSGGSFQTASVNQHLKGGGDWFSSGEGCSLQRRAGSGTVARARASALIAKIPFTLAYWIAATSP